MCGKKTRKQKGGDKVQAERERKKEKEKGAKNIQKPSDQDDSTGETSVEAVSALFSTNPHGRPNLEKT